MEFTMVLGRFPRKTAIPTLGGQSQFCVWVSGGTLVIQNSKGTTKAIGSDYWVVVLNRRRSLGARKDRAGEYVDPNWHLPPPTDRIFAPYVAAVMRYMGG